MSAPADISEPRLKTYLRLMGHNRRISALRVLVPAIGVAVFVLLVVEMVVTGLVDRFGFAKLEIDKGAVTVAAPRYAGTLADGSTYLITASSARAAVTDFDAITLGEARLLFTRADGLVMTADADKALLSVHDQQLSIPGITRVGDSKGAHGTLEEAHLDWPGRRLTVRGRVHLVNAAGSVLDAAGLDYDQKADRWTFRQVTLTLPQPAGGIE